MYKHKDTVSEQIEKVGNIGTKHTKNSYALDWANEHGEIFMNESIRSSTKGLVER